MKCLVSDTSFFKIGKVFYYGCIIVDLWNREIVGYSVGKHKDGDLVISALRKIGYSLILTELFHTDRGLEYKNKKIDLFLEAFNIKRSFSDPGTPNHNAVAEATFKTMKTEFFDGVNFESYEEFVLKFNNYVYFYNNKRDHSYNKGLSPVAKRNYLNKVS